MRPSRFRQILTQCTAMVLVLSALTTLAFGQKSISADQPRSKLPAVFDQHCEIVVENASFVSIIKAIKSKTNVNFVVDGQPRQNTMDFSATGTLREVLDRFSDKCDYTWKVTAGVVVMNKRFNDPEHLPQIHFMEIKQATKDIVTAFNSLSYDAQAEEARLKGEFMWRWPGMLSNLAGTFTNQQATILRGGGSLAMTDLSPQQSTLLEDAIFNNCLGEPRRHWACLLTTLNALPDSYLLMDIYTGPNDVFALNVVDSHKKRIPSDITIFASKTTFTDLSPANKAR